MPASDAAGTMPATLSFAEFTDRAGLNSRLRRAFEVDLRLAGQPFHYRPLTEWETLLRQFRTADRTRRVR